jgi:YidC/Oxa1 family membrane protein insertase
MELQPGTQDDSQRMLMTFVIMMVLIMMMMTMFRSEPQPPAADKAGEKAPPAQTDDTKGKDAPAKEPKAPELKPAAPEKGETQKTPEKTKGEEKPPEKPQAPPEPEPEPETFTLASKLLSVTFTNHDAAIERLTLLDHFRTPLTKAEAQKARKKDPEADIAPYGLPLLGQTGTGPSAVLSDRPPAAGQAEPTPVFVERNYEIVTKDDPRKAVFRTQAPGKPLEITKTFSLPADDAEQQRHVDITIEFKNLGDTPIKVPGYRLRGAGGLSVDHAPKTWMEPEPSEDERKGAAATMGGAVATENEAGGVNVARESANNLKEDPLALSQGRVLWAAAQSNYFVSILQPIAAEGQENFVYSGGAEGLGEHNLTAHVDSVEITLQPGESVTHTYRLYAGPKSRAALAAYDARYENILEDRWLDFLTDLMAWILRAAYWIIPNYGVGIIILTILVRTALHPLSKKSQTSMQKMQKLNPQVQELRKKFEKDKRRQQEEMMKLYKEYGVNPLGGCFPIFLQIPVFIGLWRCLRESIELRHAPFVFWIRDLSQPDYFMQTVNILPLISVVVMFVQQRMMPKHGDPQQQQTQKIMGYMMPALLGFLFYSMPSGLNLYFSASMFIGILEQKVIRAHMDAMGDLKPIVRKPGKQDRKAVPTRPGKGQKRKPF